MTGVITGAMTGVVTGAMRALVLASLMPLAVHAATLRPFVSLDGPVVRLSDLWDGVVLDRPLGPAPAPGARLVVEQAQLTAIARQFAVDWHSTSTADRAVLDRAGRALGRDDVLPALREALAGTGLPPGTEIEMPAITAAAVPVGPVQVSVQQLEADAGTGRFTALLQVTAEGVAPSTLRVSGRAIETIELPVLRRRMTPGAVMTGADLTWATLRAGQARGEVVRAPAQAVGLAARHTLQPGQAIQLADLGRPIVIEKGQAVTMQLDSPGLQLSAQGVAMEPAGVGDVLPVLNPLSRMVVRAEVTGPGRARVLPGTAPVLTNKQVALR